ncbi:ganglioside GM2 activator-like [Haliotis rufescens]|uniref:ganglioside GM2 activator-like n=1 Tax=Haliotis rufescens TaxID=6454 RepID=UPI00201ED198|nr:ganglioside GM2 activator-like [Haliotis rufescens]
MGTQEPQSARTCQLGQPGPTTPWYRPYGHGGGLSLAIGVYIQVASQCLALLGQLRFIMLLLVVALIVPALGARPGFTDTGTIEWRDCGVGDSWVSVKQFDITPTPIKLPGDMTVTLDGTINHDLSDQVTLDVLIEKNLLGLFTRVGCIKDVGTCHYTDPCHFLDTFKNRGTCPPQLTANGLPCTCPFSPMKLHLPPSKFTVTSIGDFWKLILDDGELHVKITMNDKRTNQLRGCVEAYLDTVV